MLDQLPYEILDQILRLADPKSLVAVSKASRGLNNLANAEITRRFPTEREISEQEKIAKSLRTTASGFLQMMQKLRRERENLKKTKPNRITDPKKYQEYKVLKNNVDKQIIELIAEAEDVSKELLGLIPKFHKVHGMVMADVQKATAPVEFAKKHGFAISDAKDVVKQIDSIIRLIKGTHEIIDRECAELKVLGAAMKAVFKQSGL